MYLENSVLVIFIVGYCHAFSHNGSYHVVQKRQSTINLNQGEVCDEVDGVLWKCEPIMKCSISYFSSLNSTKPILCKFHEPNPIFCCPISNNVKPDVDLSIATSTPSKPQKKPSVPVNNNVWNSQEPTSTTKVTSSTSTTRKLRPVKPLVGPSGTTKPSEKMTISDRKCKEYSEAVYQASSISTLHIQASSPKKVDTCSIRQMPLIVGGELVLDKEFPHQVLLGYNKNGQDDVVWGCGGSLISEYYILTAAHCGTTQFGPPKVALLGVTNFETGDSSTIPLGKVTIYPSYFETRPYNDIALIRTEREVQFDGYVRPACLQTVDPSFPLLYPEGSVLATGWGLTNNGGAQSKDLLKVKLNLIKKDKCDEFYDLDNGVDDERMVCAGDLERSRDTCSGDSGGPLQAMLKEPYCMYTIMGITSIGLRDSCGTQKPSVFTRVSYYIPWIEKIVWPSQ